MFMEIAQTKKARLNVDCTLDERRLIRILAAKEDKNISQYILGLIRRELKREGLLEISDLEHLIN